MLRALITQAFTASCIAALQVDVGDTSLSAVVTSLARYTTATTTSIRDGASDATAAAAASVQQAVVTPESVTASGVSTAADITDVEDTAAVHIGKHYQSTATILKFLIFVHYFTVQYVVFGGRQIYKTLQTQLRTKQVCVRSIVLAAAASLRV
jgi:hypothetical protein